jgi:hypothetical protein
MISSDSNQKLNWMPSKGLLSMGHLSLLLDSFMKDLGKGTVTSPVIMKPGPVDFIVSLRVENWRYWNTTLNRKI